MTTTPLNDRQERFIHEYLIDMNAAAAARRAGYADSTRGNQAAALMKNPLVRERIALAMADLFAELKLTARELMRERARVAFFRPVRMLDETGRLLPLHQIDEETASVLIVHHDVRPNGQCLMRIRQPDRQKALAALEKAYAHAMEMMQRDFAPEQSASGEPPAAQARPMEPAEPVEPVYQAEPSERKTAKTPQARQAAWTAPGKHAEPVNRAEPMNQMAPIGQVQCMEQTAPPAPAPQACAVSTLREADVPPEEDAQPASVRPAQEQAYDFRSDPEWMLGGAYRFKDRAPALPKGPRAAGPAQRVPMPSRVAAAVRRAFGPQPAPSRDRGEAGTTAVI